MSHDTKHRIIRQFNNIGVACERGKVYDILTRKVSVEVELSLTKLSPQG